jgi:stalled ribosome rescue protein Dom34
MQKRIGVWIDLKRAVIVSLDESNKDIRIIPSLIEKRERIPGETRLFARFGEYFLEFSKKKENRMANKIRAYLKKVATEIKDASEIVLFGPADMKTELDKFMRNDKLLAGRIRSVKTADSMTDNQIVAWVKNHYKNSKS